MKRLTKRSGINYIARNQFCDYNAVLTDTQLEAAYQQCTDKLGEYEDIDEEIGIDYISLNELRKADKIYVKFFNEIQEYDRFKIDLRECKILYGYVKGKGYCLQQPLSNYNKGFSIYSKSTYKNLFIVEDEKIARHYCKKHSDVDYEIVRFDYDENGELE